MFYEYRVPFSYLWLASFVPNAPARSAQLVLAAMGILVGIAVAFVLYQVRVQTESIVTHMINHHGFFTGLETLLSDRVSGMFFCLKSVKVLSQPPDLLRIFADRHLRIWTAARETRVLSETQRARVANRRAIAASSRVRTYFWFVCVRFLFVSLLALSV
jgi:hypothetical protein